MYKDIDAEIEDFFKQGEEEIDAYLSSIGEEAVEANKMMHPMLQKFLTEDIMSLTLEYSS